jgi:ATP-binding protein involved in chromosome partitioning
MQEKSFEQLHEDMLIKEAMAKIKYKIMVMSNKGGVGKSTMAATLAEAIAMKNNKVGLLDADIHGPSQGKIFNINEKLNINDEDKIVPFMVRGNLKVITAAGILAQEDQPLIWRGPRKAGLIRQFIKDVDWGNLDYLIIDAPPGTGDEPLAVAQMIPNLSGIVIVTTPQELAVLDSKKAISFAHQLDTKIIGMIENMATLECPHCKKQINLFDSSNKKEQLGIDLLGKISFDPLLLQSADQGNSFMQKCGSESHTAQTILAIIEKIEGKLI